MRQIVLAGVGGQGILLASRVLARAALDAGLDVRTAETIGMAQRGGSVVTHVRIAGESETLLSPMVATGQGDAVVAFEPGEALRYLGLLRYGGSVAVPDVGVCPSMSSASEVVYDVDGILGSLKSLADSGRIGRLEIVDAAAVCEECGSRKVLNTVMLAAASAAGMLGFGMDEMRQALATCVKPAYLEMNQRAFALATGEAGGS